MYIDIIHVYTNTFSTYCVCYCIGYTSDNEWSTSEVPLDQYQEKLRMRREEALEGIHIHTSLLYHNNYCVLIVQALTFSIA